MGKHILSWYWESLCYYQKNLTNWKPQTTSFFYEEDLINGEFKKAVYEAQVSELIEQPDEDVFIIAEGEVHKNTETSEVQNDAGSDAEMSGS